MVEEQTESGFGTAVRAFAFDGDEAKYRSWEGKTVALAGSKGFLLALTKESTGKVLTVEEYEYGEVEEPGVAVTGGGATPTTTRATTKTENRKYAANAQAWTYLVASCTGKAYALIERCNGDPYKAWSILQEKYCATDAEENYPELDQSFNDCKLSGTKKDPELWFNDLDHLNMRLRRINLKYEKDELQMKSHMMTAMSNDYDSVIVKFRGELNETPLAKLRKEVVLQYKTLMKASGSKTSSESVLSANVSKHPYKKFKGNCRNCGKIGHKANECRSAKVETTGGSTKKDTESDKSHVKCYNCQEMGHYANKCTKPKKAKTENTEDMGMFVGFSVLDCTLDESEYGEDGFFDNFSDSTSYEKEENEEDDTSYELVPFWMSESTSEATASIGIEDHLQDISSEEHHVGVTTMSDYVGSASVSGIAEEWLLDSGATCGVTYDKTLMTETKPSNRLITIGNGHKVATESQGSVTLTNEKGQKIKLTDVFYAPTFTKHIISMAKLIQDDWTLSVADKTEFVFAYPGTKDPVRFLQNSSDKLFYLSATRTVDDTSTINSLTTAPVTLDINIAHGLLGHPDTRTVISMAKKEGWTLTGTIKPCGSCALAKARAKAIPKSTMTKATVPGERLFLDISGPYSDSLNQNKYWLRIVDDCTRYSWDCFLPRKTGIQDPLLKLVTMNKAAAKPCKYLRCDNAGENESYVQQVCAENDIQLEMTAPNTPQMNGVVERSFATCKNRAFATMYCARFSLATQGLLWPEAVNTVTKIGNSLPRQGLAQDPHTAWFGKDTKPNRILGHLQPFGRIAYVTDRKKIKAKLDVRATKCVFIGYAVDHSGDTYKFYNPETKSTFLSRDVHQWMEWHGRITATDDMDLFTELEKLKQDSIILPETPVIPILTDADFPEDAAIDQVPALTQEAVPADATSVPTEDSTDVVPPARRNLAASFGEGAITRSRTRHVSYADVCHRSDDMEDIFDFDLHLSDEIMELLAMSATLQSDPQLGVPKNFKELLKLNNKDWFKSLNGELENFLSREAWEFLQRKALPPGRKTLRCRWIFKEKLDGTKKARSVVLGYQQEPGIDFNESYSPLATNTTIRVVLAMSLYYYLEYDDWVNIMLDVEAAFLNAKVDTDIFIELPEGLREYMLTKGIDLGDSVIKLRSAQYGLVQSPRLWMETFAKILKSLGLVQCKTDPCLFCLFGQDQKLLALVVVYCDDCILSGRSKWVNKLKLGIAKQVKISDLGKLKRHLGVDYKFGRDEHGHYIGSSMKDYHESMVRDFEKEEFGSAKTFSTPGAAVTPPLRSTPDDEIIMLDKFRSYVGRIMFACGKTEPTLSNACRELTVHLTAPNHVHWTALKHLMGYVKTGNNQGFKMRTPKDTRVVAFVDSDYASDRGDRKSISGYLVTIGGCLVSWQSKKQTGVTLSSTEAEFVSMSMAATEVKFVVSLLTEMGNGPPVGDGAPSNGPMDNRIPIMPSIIKEDNTGAIFMAKNTAIGQRTKHVDIRYRFVNDMILSDELLVEHIRSGDNPSDAMTKNLPLNLFAKHASLISEGLLGNLYDHQNTEDVKIYSATVPEIEDSTVVSSCLRLDYDATVDVCAANHTVDEGWTTVPVKNKKERKPVVKGVDQEPRIGKEPRRIHKIKLAKDVGYGIGCPPVSSTAGSIPPVVHKNRREQRPNQ